MKRTSRLTADITLEAHSMLRQMADNKERSKGWLLEKMIRAYCGTTEEPKKEQVSRSKPKTYPANFDEQFEILWDAKGKKGAKIKAREKYKTMLINSDNDTCEQLTHLLVADIKGSMNEIGFTELHLTTYLNQERWEK